MLAAAGVIFIVCVPVLRLIRVLIIIILVIIIVAIIIIIIIIAIMIHDYYYLVGVQWSVLSLLMLIAYTWSHTRPLVAWHIAPRTSCLQLCCQLDRNEWAYDVFDLGDSWHLRPEAVALVIQMVNATRGQSLIFDSQSASSGDVL